MRELPILFSTPMVQAILENRKTMTRRTAGLEKINVEPDRYRYDGPDEEGKLYFERLRSDGTYTGFYYPVKQRYQVGDKLWVKETFFYAEGDLGVTYKADYTEEELKTKPIGMKWKPSLFMPKDYARIWLEVIGVCCERLHDITESDAIAEGIERWKESDIDWYRYKDYQADINWWLTARNSFISLWRKINGKGSWNKNPWVFVCEFKRIEKP